MIIDNGHITKVKFTGLQYSSKKIQLLVWQVDIFGIVYHNTNLLLVLSKKGNGADSCCFNFCGLGGGLCGGAGFFYQHGAVQVC